MIWSKQQWKKVFIRTLITITIIIVLVAILVLTPITPKQRQTSKLGFTYSIYAAEALGLNHKEAFAEILQELSPDIIRIPIYWDLIEQEEGNFDWSLIDEQLTLLENTNTEVILAIGHKLPRWPECHLPSWVTEENIDTALTAYIEQAVNRYKDHPNLYAWQVQNEVLFTFGECPQWSGSRKRLKEAILTVQSIDSEHKVTTSDSGELSTWLRTATLPIDALSISLYRAVYNESHDYFYWPVNPYYYKLHALLVRPFVKDLIISELQMEPWGPAPVQELTLAEAYKSFSPYNFDERITFAQQTGATTILGWGVEWWYYMDRVKGIDEYWNKAIEHYSNDL